jgi:hypothetical protein
MDITELGLGNPDEPLVYDLFGVDEHMGGLGGGHYRAYALNHLSGRWYHFDDSYVTTAQPREAVVSIHVFSLECSKLMALLRILMRIFYSIGDGRHKLLEGKPLRRLSRQGCDPHLSAPNLGL